MTEPLPWQNRSAGDIREIKCGVKRHTRRAQSPKRLWDFVAQYMAAICRKTAHDFPGLDGLTPEESVHARVMEISAYAQFSWYGTFGTLIPTEYESLGGGSVSQKVMESH